MNDWRQMISIERRGGKENSSHCYRTNTRSAWRRMHHEKYAFIGRLAGCMNGLQVDCLSVCLVEWFIGHNKLLATKYGLIDVSPLSGR